MLTLSAKSCLKCLLPVIISQTVYSQLRIPSPFDLPRAAFVSFVTSDNNTGGGMSRKVVQTVLSVEQDEGMGARVRRSVGRAELKNLDPFLLLDEFRVTAPAGFPDHPHRGFETVTYMLNGAFRHEDFCGHKGIINAGDLQWMTAGRGIVHCEMPHGDKEGHGLQLWVNLSKKDKMIKPAYQELLDKDIPKGEKDGVTAKVIAGEALGIKSPVYTRTPTLYIDFTMAPGSRLSQAVPRGWTAFVYTLSGEAYFGGTHGKPHHTLVLGDGETLEVENKGKESCHFVLIGGMPIKEPVVQYGPFVMNTREEISQTMQDYQLGRNGFENAKKWASGNT
ncbi:pirin isoform X2 [Lingula anatina]|uniref:Pirin n=1 Tax=Lingula anatina TaxID=7574 RepID=A0A1S3JLK5_LINAN|nr:pirin isoform X2 [Lingula anatina]|eukprot:XP_013411263.1 pirin isoform X2 [Lingula anatina]